MIEAVALARVILAIVFAAAGFAKLFNRAGTAESLADFAVPDRFARFLAGLLPLVEVGTAVLLLTPALAWWGALIALALLVVFTSAITINLVAGRRPKCQCFGQLRSEPVGWRTLMRNGALLGLATMALPLGTEKIAAGSTTLLSQFTSAEALWLGAGLVMLAQGWFLLQLFSQNGRVLMRLDAVERALDSIGVSSAVTAAAEPMVVPLGTPAPPFRLPDVNGTFTTLEELVARNKPVVLIFMNPGCGPCRSLLPALNSWHIHNRNALTLVLVSSGSREKNYFEFGAPSGLDILIQDKREIANAYGVHGTPGAIVVRVPGGEVGSPVALGAAAIMALLARTVETPEDGGEGEGSPALSRSHRASDGGSDLTMAVKADSEGANTHFRAVLGDKPLEGFQQPPN